MTWSWCSLQPAEAAEFLQSCPNDSWHQWEVEELLRVWLRDHFVSSARVCHYSSGLKKKKAFRSSNVTQDSLDYFTGSRGYMYEPQPSVKCRRQTPAATAFRETAPQRDDRSLQELTGSVCAPAALRCQLKPSHSAAASAGPTETRGQLGE